MARQRTLQSVSGRSATPEKSIVPLCFAPVVVVQSGKSLLHASLSLTEVRRYSLICNHSAEIVYSKRYFFGRTWVWRSFSRRPRIAPMQLDRLVWTMLTSVKSPPIAENFTRGADSFREPPIFSVRQPTSSLRAVDWLYHGNIKNM